MSIHLKRFRTLTFAVLALGMNLQAQDSTTPRKKEPAPAPKARITPKLVSPKAVSSTTISEIVAQNVTLAPGASQQFFAQSDYSGADKVNIAVYADPSQDLSMTTAQVWWAFTGIPFYVLADVIQGKNFYYLNTGGGSVPPYGNELMIWMQNNGTAPVTITSVTAYAIAR